MSATGSKVRNLRNSSIFSIICIGTAAGTATEPQGTVPHSTGERTGHRFRSVPIRFRMWFRPIPLNSEGSSVSSAAFKRLRLAVRLRNPPRRLLRGHTPSA